MMYPNLKSHDMLDLDAYIHITSPIRRLPDLLNIIQIMDALDLIKMSEKSKEFYTSWTNEKNIDYISYSLWSVLVVPCISYGVIHILLLIGFIQMPCNGVRSASMSIEYDGDDAYDSDGDAGDDAGDADTD